MDFIESVKEKAKNNKKTIILPEGMDKRTYKAAEQILKEGFADLIILATPEEVEENSDGADVSKATIINPRTCEKTPEYVEGFFPVEKSKRNDKRTGIGYFDI